MKRTILCAALIAPMVLTGGIAVAQGTKPVTSGAVIRGVTLAGPVGAPGSKAAATCDFSGEQVNQNGRMTGASVNCGAGGTTQQNIVGLPARFNAYCAISAPPKGGRLIAAPVPDDARHCDLSGITPKDATGQFKGAVWR
ncbi:MAG: rhizosphere induced protein [Bradyrhizobium sp.]|jgi:hypothetical protein|nr:rhizosphere induced protein [Bradyrhizobium sp.]